MKKIIALSVVLSLFTVLFQPLSVEGAGKEVVLNGTCGENATWSYDEKTKTLTICGTGGITIGEWQWEDWYNSHETECYMEKVVIQSGITSIEKEALFEAKMKEVILPETLQQIDERAFYGCTELQEIKLPSSVTVIGEEAFASCVSLKKLIIPEGVMHIGKDAVMGCRSLSLLNLPASLKTNPVKIGTDKVYALQKIENNTNFAIPVKSVKNKIKWKANGKVVRKISSGTTGKAVRKKYKISYKLHGAKISGKRKTSYRYGDSIEILCDAKKKNGCFLDWQIAKGKHAFLGGYDLEEDEFPAYGNITIEPEFIYCTIKKDQSGSVYLNFNWKEALSSIEEVALRYYFVKEKKKKIKWEEIFVGNKSKSKIRIKNLKKGEKYCFEIALFELDSDWDEEIDDIVKDDSYWTYIGSKVIV